MRKLRNGLILPDIGFGTYKIGNDDGGVQIMREAIDAGYRLIDSASYYGNEEALGKAIRSCNVPRKNLIITGKVWKDDLGYEKTARAFDLALKKTGLDYFDIYLIHWPSRSGDRKKDRELNLETWRKLIDLYKNGRTRAIGVSNFTREELIPLMDEEILPMINQIEFNPIMADWSLYDYCKEQNIQLEAYQPLGRGKVMENPLILEISRKTDLPPAMISIDWIIHNGVIPIPKSAHIDRLRENLEYKKGLDSYHDWNQIDALSNKTI